MSYLNWQCKTKRKRSSAGLPAVAAVTLYLEGVGYPRKTALPAEFVLDCLQFWGADLDHCPAFQADKVVVVFMAEGMLIVSMFVVPFDLFNKTAFDEKGKGSVDRSLGNLDVPAPHAFEESFRVKMAMAGKDFVKYPLPFPGQLKSLPGEEFPEYRPFHMNYFNEKGEEDSMLCFRA